MDSTLVVKDVDSCFIDRDCLTEAEGSDKDNLDAAVPIETEGMVVCDSPGPLEPDLTETIEPVAIGEVAECLVGTRDDF